MSKAKDEEAPESDELFDRDLLSDSDSEFLAELDRVLTPESALEPQSTELISPGLEGAPFTDDSQAAAFEPSPAVRKAMCSKRSDRKSYSVPWNGSGGGRACSTHR